MTVTDAQSALGGRLLADGTDLAELVDLDGRQISAKTWHSQAVFDRELESVFREAWVYVAHTSEIPEAGDFVARHIGIDPVIVSRSASGAINTFLNSCSHRGGQVCRVDKGNAQELVCPYHGWRYEVDGALKVVSAEREAFPEDFDKSEHNLPSARTETFNDLIFATWSDEAPPLEEFLGDFGFYIDLMLAISPDGWEVIGSPQRWEVKCNWKFGAENLSGDGYHVAFVHAVEEEAGRFPAGALWQAMWGINVSDERFGHGGRCTPPADGERLSNEELMVMLQGMHPFLDPDKARRIVESLDPRQLHLLQCGTFPLLGNVFPNFSFVVNPIPGPHGLGTTTFIRTWNPRTPETMEVVNWVIAPRGLSEEERRLVAKRSVNTFGSSGTFENDDMEAWSQIQRITRGATAQNRRFPYHILRDPDPTDWRGEESFPGPGLIYQGIATEDNQWNFWKSWLRYMVG